MSSKICCLRQHMRSQPGKVTPIQLSLDDTVLSHGLRGPNLLSDEGNLEFFNIDETRPESGSMAVLR